MRITLSLEEAKQDDGVKDLVANTDSVSEEEKPPELESEELEVEVKNRVSRSWSKS